MYLLGRAVHVRHTLSGGGDGEGDGRLAERGGRGEADVAAVRGGHQILIAVGVHALQHPLVAVGTRFGILVQAEGGGSALVVGGDQGGAVQLQVLAAEVLQAVEVGAGCHLLQAPHGSRGRGVVAAQEHGAVSLHGQVAARVGEGEVVPYRVVPGGGDGRVGAVNLVGLADEGGAAGGCVGVGDVGADVGQHHLVALHVDAEGLGAYNVDEAVDGAQVVHVHVAAVGVEHHAEGGSPGLVCCHVKRVAVAAQGDVVAVSAPQCVAARGKCALRPCVAGGGGGESHVPRRLLHREGAIVVIQGAAAVGAELEEKVDVGLFHEVEQEDVVCVCCAIFAYSSVCGHATQGIHALFASLVLYLPCVGMSLVCIICIVYQSKLRGIFHVCIQSEATLVGGS